MASTYFKLKMGEKISFYASAEKTGDGQGTVTWRESMSGSTIDNNYVLTTVKIDDFEWHRQAGENIWISLAQWASSITEDISPNDGDYYRHKYTLYVMEEYTPNGSGYEQFGYINVSVKLNDSSGGGGSSTVDELSSGAVGQIYISYSVTKTSMGQGTITWKYKTAYGQMSSAYSGITVTKDGSDIGLQPSTSNVTFATENISAGEDGKFRHTYTFTFIETNSSTGRTTTGSQLINVSAQLTDQAEPAITPIQGYISRTGYAYVQASYSHPSDYTSNVTLNLYLDDGKSKTVTVSGSASGYITLSENVLEGSSENTSYSYSIIAECQNGKTAIYNGTVYRTSRVYSIEAPNALTLTTVNNTRWLSANAYGINRGACETTTFTYASSNTAIATVDSAGNVKRVANGNCTITVTSRDEFAQCDPITVNIICIDSRDFPDDLPTGGIDMLPAELMSDIIDAVISLSDDKGIQITADVSMFNSYSTQIKDVYSVLNNTNTNIKTLCTGTSTTNTLPATFPLQNKNAEWHSIINQWLGLIHTMHTN